MTDQLDEALSVAYLRDQLAACEACKAARERYRRLIDDALGCVTLPALRTWAHAAKSLRQQEEEPDE